MTDDPTEDVSPVDDALLGADDEDAAFPHATPQPEPVDDAAEADNAGGADVEVTDDAEDGMNVEPEPAPDAADTIEAQGVVEAILFATDSPLPPPRIAQIMGVGDARTVRKHVNALNERYEQMSSAFRIEEIAGGFQILTLPKFNPWLTALLRTRHDTRLSPAALETLAIVAYRQPVLRADVEAIRGVSVGEVLHRLREMNLIKIVGRDEQIGRPMLYGTTKRFLEVFGLASLKDLPKVEELKPPE